MSSKPSGDLWDRRRRNLRALIAYKGTNPSAVSKAADLSINTLSKFLRGETHTLRWETLERICGSLNISNVAILDSSNPLSDSKMRLYDLIDKMSEEEAAREVSRLRGGEEQD